MNYIAQLLPSQRAVKSEHSHRDKKQKNAFASSDEEHGEEANGNASEQSQSLTWGGSLPENAADNLPEPSVEERRNTGERRKKNITRGRWLDSRDKQDRRKSVDIYVKI